MTETNDLPHVLAIDQLDNLGENYYITLIRGKECNVPPVLIACIAEIAGLTGSYFYTQVDTDFNDRLYVHGLCIVNSLGVYAIITPKQR